MPLSARRVPKRGISRTPDFLSAFEDRTDTAYYASMMQDKPKPEPNPDDVLRRMLSTPPKPHGKAPKKKPKKRAK